MFGDGTKSMKQSKTKKVEPLAEGANVNAGINLTQWGCGQNLGL